MVNLVKQIHFSLIKNLGYEKVFFKKNNIYTVTYDKKLHEKISNKYSLKPEKYNELAWNDKLKHAKIFYGINGIPYDWLSKYGQYVIQYKACQFILDEFQKEKEITNLIDNTYAKVIYDEFLELKCN